MIYSITLLSGLVLIFLGILCCKELKRGEIIFSRHAPPAIRTKGFFHLQYAFDILAGSCFLGFLERRM